MNKLGILMDDRYFDHAIEPHSLENPQRLRGLFPLVQERYKGAFEAVIPREACFEEIEQVHSRFYISQVREHAVKPNPFSYDRDTYLMDQSLATAQLAAGGCLEMADRVMDGSIRNGFALIRPPGHHAEPGRGMGFCVFNNIAITAKYLQAHYQLSRILILDFDIHHGNGTQEVFYDSDKVLFISVHQKGLFPCSGTPTEIGEGPGRGYTINIPVHSFFGDTEYTFLFGKLLNNVVEQYMPQIILVSAGYDGHNNDSISATTLTSQWYHTVTTMLKQCARDICGDRLIYFLEGGYNPESLAESVLATIDSLLAPEQPRVGIFHSKRAQALFHHHPLNEFWTL
ncbi:MAG: histone deacetylase [Desulfobacterium sp.]|nr:histone deacetylase [Desulfobacterium sp.]